MRLIPEMSMPDVRNLVNFPDNFARVKSGIILPDKRTIVTGHENGLVVQSDLSSGKFSVIDDCHLDNDGNLFSKTRDLGWLHYRTHLHLSTEQSVAQANDSRTRLREEGPCLEGCLARC